MNCIIFTGNGAPCNKRFLNIFRHNKHQIF